MTPETNRSPAGVIQADREAAWHFRAECYGAGDIAGWMRGNYDHNRAIQAFARHRQQSSPDTSAAEALGEPCAFIDCPPGLFRYAGLLCFKSEYSTKVGQQDAYCVDSGEYFWGCTGGNLPKRQALVVTPVTIADTSAANWKAAYLAGEQDAHHDRDTSAARVPDEVREALEWYGEQALLCQLIHSERDPGRQALARDGGKRAAAALSAVPATPTAIGEEHGLGPHAVVVEDGPDGFDDVAVLVGEVIYLQQGDAQIFMSCRQAAKVAALTAASDTPANPAEQVADDVHAALWAADAEVERLEKELERIAWHEITWQEARDIARAALATGGSDTPAGGAQ